METIDIYTERYWLARKQYAIAGDATVDYKVLRNLKEAEDGIAEITKELETVLSTVYDKKVVVIGLEDD